MTIVTRNQRLALPLPREGASLDELTDFFDRHDGAGLIQQEIMEEDRGHNDLDRAFALAKQ